MPSVICAKAKRSSTVETSPPAPDSKSDGLANRLSRAGSMISKSTVAKFVQLAVGSRLSLLAGTLTAVSFMPSGEKICFCTNPPRDAS